MALLMSLKLFLCRIKFKEDIIISSPDVYLIELGPDVEFVLLATDGLWDYIKRSIQIYFIFVFSFSPF
jgi:protein phosphatase 1A